MVQQFHFWVFIPNFAFLIALLLIIALIIIVILLLNKIKKLTPTDPEKHEDFSFDTVAENDISEDDVNFFEGDTEPAEEIADDEVEQDDSQETTEDNEE